MKLPKFLRAGQGSGAHTPARPALWVKCVGEAHSNPLIDHCSICMPWWEEYPVCPDCGRKLHLTRSARESRKFFCTACRHYFSEGDRASAYRAGW